MEAIDLIIKISALVGALTAVGGAVVGAVMWFLKQNKQTADITELKNQHDEDIKAISDELCIISFAMLAALDGLKQQGCNGKVTEAHGRLEKNLNQKAHGQT